MGAESASETDGGGPLTVTLPVSRGWSASWYRNDPAVESFFDQDWPACRIGDAKAPLSATTWWSTLSTFRHVTVSSWLIVRLDGENAVLLIWTVTDAAEPVGAATSAAAARTSTGVSSFRISGTPSSE